VLAAVVVVLVGVHPAASRASHGDTIGHGSQSAHSVGRAFAGSRQGLSAQPSGATTTASPASCSAG
jgi:hypothetical protein